MFQSKAPAGATDVREIRDVADGAWLWIDAASLDGLERSEQAGWPIYKVGAANYALVFKFKERLTAMVSRRLPIPQRLMKALDWPGVMPYIA